MNIVYKNLIEKIDRTIYLPYWIYDDTHTCECVCISIGSCLLNMCPTINYYKSVKKRSHCINNWPGILIINMPHSKLLLVNFMHTIKYGMLFFLLSTYLLNLTSCIFVACIHNSILILMPSVTINCING